MTIRPLAAGAKQGEEVDTFGADKYGLLPDGFNWHLVGRAYRPYRNVFRANLKIA